MKRRMQKYQLELTVNKEQSVEIINALNIEPKAGLNIFNFNKVNISFYVDTQTGDVSDVKIV